MVCAAFERIISLAVMIPTGAREYTHPLTIKDNGDDGLKIYRE
jgi:hypothetical protein